MIVKVKVEVPQSCLTLCNPMDFSPQGSSVHGILHARILEWFFIFYYFIIIVSQYRLVVVFKNFYSDVWLDYVQGILKLSLCLCFNNFRNINVKNVQRWHFKNIKFILYLINF